MKKRTKSNLKTYLLLIPATFVFTLVVNSEVSAQTVNYKTGDRVECEVTGNPKGKWWMKGTIEPFKDGDFGVGIEPDGSWFRFKADANKVEYPCKPEVLRAISVTQKQNTAKQTTEKETETMPDVDYVECPINQKKVSNAAKPNAELAKKIIRCRKGEQAVDEGDEGAVTVEIYDIQIGTARPWTYAQDSGNGKVGTLVYPVKATYAVKTHYRAATEVQEGWVRIFNFYVNAFGEWEIGSEENIKGGKFRRIPK